MFPRYNVSLEASETTIIIGVETTSDVRLIKRVLGYVNMPVTADYVDNHSTANLVSGAILIIFGSILFLAFTFAAVISKLLPPFDSKLLSAIQNDRYYCLLVPLTLPVVIVAVYFHWLSMKLFKHA